MDACNAQVILRMMSEVQLSDILQRQASCPDSRLLLRRNMLCRYLAVRLGLNVAVVKDVFGQHERTALDRVQPQSLTHHYKFATHARHLSDARPVDADLVSITHPCNTPPAACNCFSYT